MTSHRHLVALLALLVLTPRPARPAEPATQPATRPAAAATQPATRPAALTTARAAASGLNFDREVLPNGVEVLVSANRTNPMVAIFALVGAGVTTEGAQESGMSHFLEHLLFNGTDTLTQEELYAKIDRMGGYFNATTRVDHTLFQMLFPRRAFAEATDLLGAVLFRSSFPADKIDKERGIVLEEIAKDAVDPEAQSRDQMAQVLYAGTPLTRPVAGTPEALKAEGREAIVAYWKRTYVPANVTLLILGDVAPAEAFAAAARSFGAAAGSGEAPAPRLGLRLEGRRLETFPLGGDRRFVQVAFPGVEASDARYAAAALLADVLGGQGAGTISGSLEDSPLGFGPVSADLRITRGVPALVLATSVNGDADPHLAVAALRDAARQAANSVETTRLDALKLERTTDDLKLAERIHYYGIERADLLANGGAAVVESLPEAIAATGSESVKALAERLWAGPYLAAVSGPGLSRNSSVEPTPTAPTAASTAAVSERSEKLGNGLALYVASSPASRVFALHVLIKDRAAREPQGRQGIADLLHRSLSRGAGPYDAAALGRELGAAGVSIKLTDEPNIPFDDYYDSPEFSYLRLECPPASAPRAVKLVGLMLREPRLDAAEVEKARSEQLRAISQAAATPTGVGRQAFAHALYGDHPLGASPRGTEASVKNITLDELRAFHHDYVAPPELIVSVVTDLAPDAVVELVTSALGGAWPARKLRAPAPLKALTTVQSEERALGASQSQVRLGNLTTIAPGREAAALMADAVLNDKLQMTVREGAGIAYSIGSGLTLRGGGTPATWSISLGTRPENLERAKRMTLDALAAVRETEPTSAELQTLVGRIEGRELMRRITSIGQAYGYGLDLFRGGHPGDGVKLVQALAAVKPAETHEAARKLYNPRAYAIAIVK